jgi:hypothetical protein
LGVIFSWSFPFMILVASSMMNLEPPSMIRWVSLWSRASWIPLVRPRIFVELLVSYPRFSAMRNWIWPMMFFMTAPYPEFPGFPLEAPSNLTLWKSDDGGKPGRGDRSHFF